MHSKNSSTFRPAFGLKNPHIQTLYSTLFRKRKALSFEIERFALSDGDFVECFWYKIAMPTQTHPIVILFHGLEGSYLSPYIQGMIENLLAHGYTPVLMHFRGCSGKENLLSRAYHSGDTSDAKAWIDSLHSAYPHAPLFAIGYSIGGNMLLKLLGEWKAHSPLVAMVSISAPQQLDICANHINKGFAKIYQYHLMKHLKTSLLQKYKTHPMQHLIGIDENEVKKLKTFWDFDGVYTAPIHGFSSAKEYYALSSAKQYIKHICIPTLIIHALDDPFMSSDILPSKEELSTHITLEVSKHGGHVGFISGSIFRPKYWLEERIIRYFNRQKVS
jgi:predicted alpha/beta-fold hydrolase